MIAFVIILIVMLGLLNLTAQVTEVGLKNTVRDEAVRLAEEIIDQERAKPFNQISSSSNTITRNIRNFPVTYTATVGINGTSDSKIINVTISWNYRGTNYTHNISSLVRRTE